ncbi:MAG: hypothetical protein K2O81_06555 [Clostridia bacterium]|nr:hypothetical protein [Clostridia bacterium]
MNEFKGKFRFSLAFLVIGIALVALSVLAICLSISFKQIAVGVIGGSIFLTGGTGIFLVGLKQTIYSRKIIIKVYNEYFEFIPYGKLFIYERQKADYADIQDFRVSREGCKSVKNKKVIYKNFKYGTIEFMLNNRYCRLEVDDCRQVGKLIMENLDESQINKQSELRKEFKRG